MKENRRRRLTVLIVAVLALCVSTGCPVPPEPSESDSFSTAKDVDNSGLEDKAFPAKAIADVETDPAKESAEESLTPWPEGWMVAHREEWIPVLDELGLHLHSARAAFSRGDRSVAATEVRGGIDFLERLSSEASDRDRAALENAITTLQAIADRLSMDREVTVEQIDIAFTNAYRSDLEREALVVDTDSAVHYLERPEKHLERALEQFVANETQAAASEIDKASAFLRLEGNRLDLAERAQLITSAQDLEHVAARLRLKEIRERAELERVFEPVRQQWRRLAQPPDMELSPGEGP